MSSLDLDCEGCGADAGEGCYLFEKGNSEHQPDGSYCSERTLAHCARTLAAQEQGRARMIDLWRSASRPLSDAADEAEAQRLAAEEIAKRRTPA